PMKLPAFLRSTPPIGVDIAGRWIKAAQVDSSPRPGSAPRLLAAARVARRDSQAPFAAEDAELVAGVLDRARFRGRKVVLAEPLLAALSAAGLEVLAIDAPGVAMARALEAGSPEAGLTAILEVGWHAALLVVLHNGIVLYERSIAESSLSHLFASVKSRLGL